MSAITASNLELEQVKAELEAWRSEKSGHKRIPQHLWDKAYALLKSYSISVVSQQLRLDHNKLRRGINSFQKLPRQNIKRKKAFFELKSSDLQTATLPNISSSVLSQPQATCRIVFERSDGSRLSLFLPTDWSKIEAICNGFLRG
jgi:hypothetical protein